MARTAGKGIVMATRVKYAADGKTPLSVVRKRLEWVERHILAEPERYDQGTYVAYGTTTCGTVGCIAGWLDVQKNGIKAHVSRINSSEVRSIATAFIGVREDHYPWLFFPGIVTAKQGTKAAAREACRHIDRYLKEIGA